MATAAMAPQASPNISATIPMALHEAINDGRIKAGDIVAMVGFGAGLSWGGILMEI